MKSGPEILRALESGALRAPDASSAARALRNGAVVAFPTETVYGIGVDPFNEEAAARVFRIKGRTEKNPLTCHVLDREQAKNAVREIPAEADLLMERYWPGPLTLVLPAADNLPKIIRAGRPGVGVRAPDQPAVRQVLKTAGIPIAGTSANLSGRPAAVRPKDLLNELGSAIDLLIDAGECRLGHESTVLDLTERPAVIWRVGAVPPEELRAVLEQGGIPLQFVEAPAALGGYLRSRPDFRIVVIRRGSNAELRANDLAESLKAGGRKVGLLLEKRTPGLDQAGIPIIELGGSPGRRLYTSLREAENMGIEVLIFIESDGSSMEHVAERLLRAGGEAA